MNMKTSVAALMSLLCLTGALIVQAQSKKPQVDNKRAEKKFAGWPDSRGKAMNDPGPAKIDLYDNKTLKCATDSDCNSSSHGGNICTDSGICLCDASQGQARCGKEGNQDCSNLLSGLNCGACGHECPRGQLCNDGKCGAVHCDKGETFCLAHCSDLRTSTFDCGRCGHECRGGFVCVNGQCRP